MNGDSKNRVTMKQIHGALIRFSHLAISTLMPNDKLQYREDSFSSPSPTAGVWLKTTLEPTTFFFFS